MAADEDSSWASVRAQKNIDGRALIADETFDMSTLVAVAESCKPPAFIRPSRGGVASKPAFWFCTGNTRPRKMCSIRLEQVPSVLRSALFPHMLRLLKSAPHTMTRNGERLYKYVTAQSGVRGPGGFPLFRGWQVQLSIGGKLRRIAHTQTSDMGALLAAAALLDERLSDIRMTSEWIFCMVYGGAEAVTRWLCEVDTVL